MMNSYALAIETEQALKVLPFGPLTLAKAEEWRDRMAKLGKELLVINLKAE